MLCVRANRETARTGVTIAAQLLSSELISRSTEILYTEGPLAAAGRITLDDMILVIQDPVLRQTHTVAHVDNYLILGCAQLENNCSAP